MAKEKTLSPAQQRLKAYLDNYADNDPIFALKYMTSGKTLDGCVAFITKQAQKAAASARNYFADDEEVFGWAVHYFDEDAINEEKSKPVATIETSAAKPKKAEPKAAQSKAAQPKTANPKMTKTKADKPKKDKPSTAQPSTAQTKTAQPSTAQTKTAQPSTAQTKTAQPNTAETKKQEPVQYEFDIWNDMTF